MDTMIRVAGNGRVFACHLIWPGARYGRNGALVNNEGEALVEFWDLSHPHEAFHAQRDGKDAGVVYGQFTGGRYFASTLLEGDVRALSLMGSEPAWTIDAVTMGYFRVFLALHAALPVSAR